MRLRFRCGCPSVEINIDTAAQIRCPACGERKVARVLGDTTPRFVGHGRGPLVRSAALEPIPVNLAPQGALPLKRRKDDDATVRDDIRPH